MADGNQDIATLPPLAVMPLSNEARRFNRLLRYVVKPVSGTLVRMMPGKGLWLSGSMLQMVTPRDRAVRALRYDVGGVPCDVVLPSTESPGRTLLYLHGGGFTMHAPEFYRRVGHLLAEKLRARVVIPDYRLAPAHRYPAASDDCYRVYAALIVGGCPPSHLAVLGDSAGGNLLLSTLLRARDSGLPMPACAVPISPATDLTASSPSLVSNASRDPMISAAALPWLARAYADAEHWRHPYASPVFGDYRGLPPLSFFIGESEVLRDDGQRAAAAAMAAGVSTEVHLWPEMPHVFPLFQFLPEARLAMGYLIDFVARHTRFAASFPYADSPLGDRS